MSVSTLDFEVVLRRERAALWRRAFAIGGIGVVVAAAGYYTGLFDAKRFAEGLPAMWQLASESIPPDFSRLGDWIWPLIDTLAMSIAGTALAVILSIPLAFLAASNTTPHKIVYRLARLTLNGLRAVPELIMGIVFVAAVGFGLLPGVLALGLHSVGMVGKFFAEAIEHVDPKPVEAIAATGASSSQVVWHAILPQVLPQFADVTVYRWEFNFRASTVMGMVGAGGIGFELMASLRLLQYQEVFALMLTVLFMVTLVDGIGAILRRRLK